VNKYNYAENNIYIWYLATPYSCGCLMGHGVDVNVFDEWVGNLCIHLCHLFGCYFLLVLKQSTTLKVVYATKCQHSQPLPADLPTHSTQRNVFWHEHGTLSMGKAYQ